ncbi:aquaporin-like protein [Mycena belliarum]|uniref:Aquaporin-like protein n=1 Tax=Mycena belliarum TaxID=1033014 RepID=A0AAD6TX96_9AGAR|nr:aquaporin-like protein [Mycena belliae]
MSSILYLSDIRQRPRAYAAFERHRHSTVHWLVECFAEALGVFLYTYAGVGSQALPPVSEQINPTTAHSNNPDIRYLTAQILGGYIACMLVYVQYKSLIIEAEEVLQLAGPGVLDSVFYTPSGPGGIFALALPAGSNMGRAFVNEFVVDFMLGIVIFAAVDPTNFLLPPSVGPMVIALAYGVAIWSFSANGLAANAARDVGGRLAALSIWGLPAGGGAYAALAALTNIPATLLACVTYELLLTDSDRVIAPAHMDVINAHKYHRRTGTAPELGAATGRARTPESDPNFDQKGHVGKVERV